MTSPQLAVVSNRLPVRLSKDDDGQWTLAQGAGGLVTAMAPVLRNRGGSWVGWNGLATEEDVSSLFEAFSRQAGYELHPVQLTPEQEHGFYAGFSNEILWPLFHDLPTRCNFYKPDYWRHYRDVNQLFAETIAAKLPASTYCWVHDYHLMLVAGMLRKIDPSRRCGFFLHIPFPPPDNFLKLPWRKELLLALMEHELVAFHTLRDRRNFEACLQSLLPKTVIRGRGAIVQARHEGRAVRIGAIPISIDYKAFTHTAGLPQIKEAAHALADAYERRTLILGVDRLDYTKGIPERLEALRLMLQQHPELREKISFIQVLVPSREDVSEYRQLKMEIEQMVGEINGQFATPGWSPIHYQYRNMPREELVGYYLAAHIMFVTPLRDGMNLVAKEYCACRRNNTGVLILSEFAGAAAQLQRDGAVLVNPFDIQGMANALQAACMMPMAEQKRRMQHLREIIRKHDIYFWCETFLNTAFALKLADIPQMEDVQFHELG